MTIYNIYNDDFMDKDIITEIQFAMDHPTYQMKNNDVSLINLGIAKLPTKEGQVDYYHPASIKGTGWSPLTGMFHMEAKTWFYCLELNIKENGFKVGYCNSWGKYISVNKTYNAGDIVRFYMTSDLEFAEKAGAKNAEINIYFVLPFIDWYKKDLGLPHIKGVIDDMKKTYLIQENRSEDTKTVLDMFNYGKPKLVKLTANLNDSSNKVLGNVLDGSILHYTKATDKFNRYTEDVYFLVNIYHANYIEKIE